MPTPPRAELPERLTVSPSGNIFDGEWVIARSNCHPENETIEAMVSRYNSHAALVRALRDAEVILSAIECGEDKPLATGMALDQARKALRNL